LIKQGKDKEILKVGKVGKKVGKKVGWVGMEWVWWEKEEWWKYANTYEKW